MHGEGAENPESEPSAAPPGEGNGNQPPDADSAEARRGNGGPQKLDITSLALQLLAAFGTGIGVLGFVVFFGAAILWIRYDRAGLPADEAVAVVPKPALLTTGAEFLAPALAVALASVLVLLVIDLILRGRRSLRTPAGLRQKEEEARSTAQARQRKNSNARQRASEAERTKDTLDTLDHSKVSRFRRWRANWRVAITRIRRGQTGRAADRAKRAAVSAGAALRRAEGTTTAKDIHDVLAEEDFTSEFRVTAAFISVVLLVELVVIGGSALRIGVWQTILLLVLVAAFVAFNRWVFEQRTAFRLGWQIIGILGAGLISVAVIGRAAHALGSWDELVPTAILVAVALVTVAISWLVYRQTQRVVALGVATFLSVGIFAGAATYSRTADNLKLEPAAVLRKSQGPVTGVFVAHTSTRFYLGVA